MVYTIVGVISIAAVTFTVINGRKKINRNIDKEDIREALEIIDLINKIKKGIE